MKINTLGWFILVLWLNWLHGRIYEAYVKNAVSTQIQVVEFSYSLVNLFILYKIYSVTDINIYLKYFYFILLAFHLINSIESIIWLYGVKDNKFSNMFLNTRHILVATLSYCIVTFLCLFIYFVFGK